MSTEPEVATPPVELKPVSVLCVATPDIRPIKDLNEWFDLMDEAKTVEEILGLLHIGFDMEVAQLNYLRQQEETQLTETDRVICYLNLADGHESNSGLEIPEDGNREYPFGENESGFTIHVRPSNLRQLIAQKAFSQLCNHFFKKWLNEKKNGEGSASWAVELIESDLFVALQYFLRTETSRSDYTLPNLKLGRKEGIHHKTLVIDFILRLAKFLWEWREYHSIWQSHLSNEERLEEERKNTLTRSHIERAKPWIIEVLAALGELHLLRKYLLNLDEGSVVKLKDMALKYQFKSYSSHSDLVSKERPVANLEEALLLGSPEARLVIEHGILTNVHSKLKEVRETEREVEKVQKKLSELQGK